MNFKLLKSIFKVIPYLFSFFFTLFLIPDINAQSENRIHFKSILVDTHNDVLSTLTLEGKNITNRLSEGHSDLYRFKEGGVDVQFFSIWTSETARNKEGYYKDALQEIDSLKAIVNRSGDKMLLATTYAEVKKGIKQHKLVSLIGVEGGHMIENDIYKLDDLYSQGMRYMTLTWNNSTSWASSAKDETAKAGKSNTTFSGLSDFGKQIVQRMNESGIIVDLSHVGEKTFYDAIVTTSKPVLLSHSSVYNICPHFRNVKDEQIKAVAKNGGVICINFFPGFISKEFNERFTFLTEIDGKPIRDSIKHIYPDSVVAEKKWDEYLKSSLEPFRPTLAQVVDHIDYIVKLVGDDYVGIGSDFDGITFTPKGLDDVTKFPLLTEELIRRGYTKKSIKKILGGNVLRVMKANFK